MEQLEREVFDFPTPIPLKVIGRNEDGFEQLVLDLFRMHVAELQILTVSSRLSKEDAYLSITVTFLAQSREHLDAVYRELGQNKRVLMVI